MGYTAQFGNGFSATIAAEAPRKTQIMSPGPLVPALFSEAHLRLRATDLSPAGYGGFQVPDVVANLRVDQAWGSAQIMVRPASGQQCLLCTKLRPHLGGHPDDKLGFAIGARHQAERSDDRRRATTFRRR